jgi:hypothetical protein
MIKKLQWFNITYTNKKQANNLQEAIPLYVIKKVALATTVRKIISYILKKFTAM